MTMMMADTEKFKDADELRAFLKTITTYEQYWGTEPSDYADALKEVLDDTIERDCADPNDILDGLKMARVEIFSKKIKLKKQGEAK